MTSTGIVISLTGSVKAIATDGTERILHVGDRVFVDEQIVTGDAGTIAIEFADGLTMDLGRNTQSILDEEILNLEFDIKPNDAVTKQQVQVTQEALLQDKNFDPTVDLEAPAAGPTAGAGVGDDDGFSIIQVDYIEPRMTPVNGFETTGIGVDFTEILPVLILEPQQVQAPGLGGASAFLGEESELPVASIFTLNERFIEGEPQLIEGDSSRGLGFRIEPDAEDSINSVTIKGFPENSNPSESDWLIFADAKVVDQDANYQVNFLGNGPTQSADGTWEVGVEVLGALPGEGVEFILTVIPFNNITNSVPLTIATTVDNSSGIVTSTAVANVGITFDQLLPDFANSGSEISSLSVDTSTATAQSGADVIGLGSLESASVVNQFVQPVGMDIPVVDVS